MTMELIKEEKLRLIMGRDWWETDSLDGKIGKIKVSDGPSGLRCMSVTDSWENASIYPAVAYPCYTMAAQTWNPQLVKKMGRAIADDCMDHDVDVLLGPGINIKRTPLCGRNFEYFSEDPYLAGVFGRAVIEGVQEGHVGTSLKHFCCNNREFSRYWLSSEVDERTLREIYLRPFEIALEAKPWTVMCSYNLVNGERMSENKTLYNLLREEMGFDGVIVSDWEAVQDPRASLHAGLDLEMPYNETHARKMKELLAAGELDESCLDESADRIIRLTEKAGREKVLRRNCYTIEERIALSQQVEEEAIVLLKNDGVLPLSQEKVYITGAPAVRYFHGGGSSAVVPNRAVMTLEEALREEGISAYYSHSVEEFKGSLPVIGNVKKACQNSKAADVTVFAVGTGEGMEVEGCDRQDLSLSQDDLRVLQYLRKHAGKLVVVVYAGCVVDLRKVHELADAVVLAGFGGQCVNQAVAGVLSGRVNPSGRLTETWVCCPEDVPAERSYRDEAVLRYEEGLDVGYRYFESRKLPVQYPFGFGLSYTTFDWTDMEAEVLNHTVSVHLTVKNTGNRDGMEVVQLYVSQPGQKVYRPLRELKAFAKVFVKAHEETRVTLNLIEDAFSYYAVEEGAWVMDGGNYCLEAGKNVHEIMLTKEIGL